MSKWLLNPKLMSITRERLHQWAMDLLYKLGGCASRSVIFALSFSDHPRVWEFAFIEGLDLVNNLAHWKKSVEIFFRILMGMYELVNRCLEFMEKEQDYIAKIVDHKLEWMCGNIYRRLIDMELNFCY